MSVVRLNSDATADSGVNIVTGIVLETLAGMKIDKRVLLINVKTLYRNFVSCLEGKTDDKIRLFKSAIDTGKIIELFAKDTMSVVEIALELNLDIKLYIPDYNKVNKLLHNVRDVKDITGVNHYIRLTEKTAESKLAEAMKGVVIKTTHNIPYFKDMFVVTHIPLDLLNYVRKKDVTLIESHTGELKTIDKWYTKYHPLGKNNMSVFPFNRILLYVLGDKYYIKPQNIKLRRLLYRMALDKHWSQGQSSATTISSIRSIDPVLAEQFDNIDYHLYPN